MNCNDTLFLHCIAPVKYIWFGCVYESTFTCSYPLLFVFQGQLYAGKSDVLERVHVVGRRVVAVLRVLVENGHDLLRRLTQVEQLHGVVFALVAQVLVFLLKTQKEEVEIALCASDLWGTSFFQKQPGVGFHLPCASGGGESVGEQLRK